MLQTFHLLRSEGAAKLNLYSDIMFPINIKIQMNIIYFSCFIHSVTSLS